MKVICIDARKGMTSGLKPPFNEGDILTVKQCPVHKTCYDVLEYPYALDGGLSSYIKNRFIPLSTIDETEISKQREKQLV